MRRLGFRVVRHGLRFVRHQAINLRLHRFDRLEAAGPLLIAPTHMGHLEGVLISSHLQRPVHWVMRSGLFFPRPWGWFLNRAGAIDINQYGACAASLRRCIGLLRAGKIVGIFPEGRVTRGAEAAVHGAPVFGGTALVSIRSGVPILPVVVLGMDRLMTIETWIPGVRNPVAVGVGEPIIPPPLPPRGQRRAARVALTKALAIGYQKTYADLKTSIAQPGPFAR